MADDLEQYPRWRPHLHDLGECGVKHGVRVRTVNFYTDEVGNPAVPEKFKTSAVADAKGLPRSAIAKWAPLGAALLILIGGFLFWPRGKVKPPPSTGAIAEKSIAVLPFDNLSRDPDNAFFADGMQDEVLTNLAKIADLKVISRTSVMQYKTGAQRNLREIAQQLGVAHVVEGSVQRAANKVRVNAQLIDARTDLHLWAQIYDRDLADVFAIQSEIAKAIAEQLHAKLSPSEKSAIEQRPTADLIAFDQYTRAKTLLLTTGYSVLKNKDSLQAIDLLNSAVARDPAFHSAYCELVFAHDSLYGVQSDRTASRLAAAEAALQSATQLQPDSPETHLAHAWHLYYAVRDYKGAMAKLGTSGARPG